ncbi:MAG: hypothetical protein K2Y22_07505 [Candidatus Obscuribacterales bacterium]|nr:hypothetical protein [Candidatus Obscuribacterales bacterium]
MFCLKNYQIKITVSASALLFFSGAAIAKHASQNYAVLYKDILAATVQADEQLVNDIETVAETLREFAQSQGHFPDTGDDIDGMALELSAVLPKNPYSGQEAPKVEAHTDFLDGYGRPEAKRARIIFDPSLNESIVDKLSMHPYSTWTAKPGTVVAVTNGYDLCLVWGAGMDEQPMRGEGGRVRLAVLRRDTD